MKQSVRTLLRVIGFSSEIGRHEGPLASELNCTMDVLKSLLIFGEGGGGVRIAARKMDRCIEER
jgi:hypothetical protein